MNRNLIVFLLAAPLFGQSITITNPTANEVISGTFFSFTASLASAPSVVKVVYTCDAYPCYHPGVDAPTTLGESIMPPFSYSFNSYWYLDGTQHQLVATAYDSLGNVVATSAAVPFAISNPWPVSWSPGMTVTTSTGLGSNWSGAVTITDTITGSGAGTDSLAHTYFVDGINQGVKSGTAAVQTGTIYTTQFPNGPHVVCVEVNDSSSPFITPNGNAGSGHASFWVGAATEWCRTVTFANGAVPMAALVNTHEVFLSPGQTFQLSAQVLNTDGSTSAGIGSPVYQLVAQQVNGAFNGVYVQGPQITSTPTQLINGVASVSSTGLITASSIGAALINVMVPTTSISDLLVGGSFGNLASATKGFTPANTGELINITSGTNWTPGVYQISSVSTTFSPAQATPVANPTVPASPGNTTNAAVATIGPTRQVWVYVNPGNATPSPCYGQDGSIQTSYTTNCMFVNSMFNSFTALQGEQPYGAGLVAPNISPGAGVAADWTVSGFNTVEFSPLPAVIANLSGTETQTNFQNAVNNYINGTNAVVEGANGLPLSPKLKGLAVGNGLFGCTQANWAIASGNESTWSPTGLTYFIQQYQATGNVIGLTTVDEITGNCGFTPLGGPYTFSTSGTTQSGLTAIIAHGGVCAAALAPGSPPFTTAGDNQFGIINSVTSGMNNVLPAVYSVNPGGAKASGGSVALTASAGSLVVGTITGGTNYWVAPLCRITGGGGTYSSCTITVDGAGHINGITIVDSTGYWSNPVGGVAIIDTSNAVNFLCPSVANGTYNASNDSALQIEPYEDVGYAGNTSWMKYDSWAKIWTQIFALSGRHLFIQNPGLGNQGSLAFANWGGNPNYPGAQTIGAINRVADAGDLYVPFQNGNYIASRQSVNTYLGAQMHGYYFRALYGAYDPAKPFTELTEATTSYVGFQGYNATVTSCSGNTITFSAPHGIANVVPGLTRLAITGATDSTATDTCNNNFTVLAAPTPTTLTVLLGATNFSIAGGFGTGGTVTTQDATTIPISTITVTGSSTRSSASQNQATNVGGGLGGDNFVESTWSASYYRKRGQTFTVSGVTGATTPTSSCLISANCNFASATFMILPENLNLSTQPIFSTNASLFYRQVPSLNATGGTAQIMADFRYHKGVNGSFPLTDLNPGWAFGSIMECLLTRCSGQRAYKVMNAVNAYSDQYGYLGSNGVIDLALFPSATNTGINGQWYINPHFEDNNSVPTFWALSNGGLIATRLAKYLLQPSLNSPDCGQFVECAARAGSFGNLFFAFNATDGPQTLTFSLTPFLQSGQQIIRYTVNDHAIGGVAILSAGTATDAPTLNPGDAVFYVFPAVFAGELLQPAISAKLADVAGAVKITVDWSYDPYNQKMFLNTFDCGTGTCSPPWDRNIGPIYFRVIYLGSSNQPIATGAVQSL